VVQGRQMQPDPLLLLEVAVGDGDPGAIVELGQ
jgi:hypothetical protein